jgi:hypothetical protein
LSSGSGGDEQSGGDEEDRTDSAHAAFPKLEVRNEKSEVANRDRPHEEGRLRIPKKNALEAIEIAASA